MIWTTRHSSIRKQEGARLACGGRPLTSGAHAKGFFHEPTIFGDCDPKMRISCEEVFGPVVSLIPVGSLDEAAVRWAWMRAALSAAG